MKIEVIPAKNGAVVGTIVRDALTKEEIEGVRSVSWTHRAGELPVITMEVLALKAAPVVSPLTAENVKIVDVTSLDSPWREHAVVEK